MARNIDGEALREVMRQVPSPVTVVTARAGEAVRGITIGSFTSVSLNPPLISFNVSREARMHDLIIRADRYVVHVLEEGQVDLSEHFARPELSSEEQFATVPHHLDPDGVPVIEGVLASIFCRPYAVYAAGDHSILVGEVVEIRPGQTGGPVLYYQRGYHGMGQPLEGVLTGPREELS